MSSGCLIAFYHYVRDAEATRFPGLKALALADFHAQLDWLGRTRTVIGYDAFSAARDAGRTPEAATLLTFDDGFTDHYDAVFPALRDRGWSGVFFLAGQTLANPPRVLNVHKTHFLVEAMGARAFGEAVARAAADRPADAGGALSWQSGVYRYDGQANLEAKHLLNYELPFAEADRILDDLFAAHLGDEAAFARRLYLSREQIAEMSAAGMTFGFHTERHRMLARLDEAGQRGELAGGVALIRRLTGQDRVPFCYPYGHPHTYDGHTLAILADAGYDSAFTTVRRHADLRRDPRYEIPRFDTRDLPPFTTDVSHA